ncbi:hypothetical protein LZ32DRAFT_602505 [Colletotrichum eremochloae]|nr:hypothetical protein LZ32DRAFT_602505 [Colletotrichum eremochloae]
MLSSPPVSLCPFATACVLLLCFLAVSVCLLASLPGPEQTGREMKVSLQPGLGWFGVVC